MPRIDINLLFSRQFFCFLFVLMLGSLGIIAWLPVSSIYKVGLILAALGYFFWILHQQQQWQTIRHDQTGWHIQQAGKTWAATLAGDSTVTNWVSVLRFVPVEGGKKRSCVVFRDMTENEKYQQLLMRTRFFNR